MPFRTHLLIISIIIAVVYAAQLLIPEPPPPAPVAPQVIQTSEFNITIARASWGLNCRALGLGNAAADPYKQPSNDSPKIKENNVLAKVSERCNGKPTCEIPLNTSALGDDPLPTCMTKLLQLEYRCFSFDRLHEAKSSSMPITIDCEKQAK